MVEAVASTPCTALVFILASKRAGLFQAATTKIGSAVAQLQNRITIEFVSRLEYIHTYLS